MAIQTMNTQAARIGKVKGDMLRHAKPMECLTKVGVQKKIPKNSSDTIIFRRTLPPSGIDNIWINGGNVETFADGYKLAEGTTPTARTMSYVDVSAVLEQYGVLYAITDKTFDLYEDDVASDMRQQIGETIGAIREMVNYGAVKGSTNNYYAGGSDITTVDETISLALLRRITRDLKRYHASMCRKIIAPSPNFGTSSVEAAYCMFCSTDMEPAIRDLPGFIHVADYGQRSVISDQEIGSVEVFRFILSPELAPYIDAGASVGTTGLYSTNGSNIDVYPVIVCGEEAWGQLALRGANSIDITWIPPNNKDKSDPMGQRGYAGAKFYHDALILNQGWMAVLYCGTPDLG